MIIMKVDSDSKIMEILSDTFLQSRCFDIIYHTVYIQLKFYTKYLDNIVNCFASSIYF